LSFCIAAKPFEAFFERTFYGSPQLFLKRHRVAIHRRCHIKILRGKNKDKRKAPHKAELKKV
jgi:hypothetical protein